MVRRVVLCVVLLVLLGGWVTDDVPLPRLEARSIDEDCGAGIPTFPEGAPPSSARGRAITALDRTTCEAELRARGVAFTTVPASEATNVAMPIRLAGPLDGVRITPDAGIHSVVDCRLAVALSAWAPDLREQGIARLEHVSIFRPNARVATSGRVSGHAHALAIDALAFVLEDGTRLSVLDAWNERRRGEAPCTEHAGDDEPTRRMRTAVCRAVERDLFQVVLTPHADDAHANHVHLEIRPGVDWTYVR